MDAGKRRERNEPDATVRLFKDVKKDTASIYEKTFAMLMNAPQDNPLMGPSPFPEVILERSVAGEDQMEVSGVCGICRDSSDLINCSHCDVMVCNMCLRQCESCQDVFCSFCSTYDYSYRYEKLFCYDCINDRSVARKNNPKQPHNNNNAHNQTND